MPTASTRFAFSWGINPDKARIVADELSVLGADLAARAEALIVDEIEFLAASDVDNPLAGRVAADWLR